MDSFSFSAVLAALSAGCAAAAMAGGFVPPVEKPLRLPDVSDHPYLRLLIFIAILAALLFLPAAFLTAAVFLGADLRRLAEDTQALLCALALLAAYALVLPPALLLLRRFEGPSGLEGVWPFWSNPGTQAPRPTWKDLVLGLLAWGACLPLLSCCKLAGEMLVRWAGLPEHENPILTALDRQPRVSVFLCLLFTVAVLVPIAEELAYRGFLYGGLRRLMKFPAAWLISAVFFGAIHSIPADFPALLAMGLLFAWLYERTGRLSAPIACHAVNNLVTLLLAGSGSGR